MEQQRHIASPATQYPIAEASRRLDLRKLSVVIGAIYHATKTTLKQQH